METQQRGLVFIAWFDSNFTAVGGIRDVANPADLLSVRASAIHICSPDIPFISQFKRYVLPILLGRNNRIKTRIHLGMSSIFEFCFIMCCGLRHGDLNLHSLICHLWNDIEKALLLNSSTSFDVMGSLSISYQFHGTENLRRFTWISGCAPGRPSRVGNMTKLTGIEPVEAISSSAR